MKKLMMAVAIVCAAVCTQAASITWNSITQPLYNGQGSEAGVSPTAPDSLNAYVILSSYSQSSFAAAYAANNGDATATLSAAGSAKVGTGYTSYGYVFGNGFTSDTGVNAYMVVFDADKVYIGESFAIYDNPTSPGVEGFFDVLNTNGSGLTPVEASSYAGNAGWYTAVPEPTSGLLLLLGVAGLALRRRRA